MSDPPRRGGSGAVAYGTPPGRWVLAITVLGSGIVFLDGTVVNVALPRMGEDLDAATSSLQWILNGYMLTLASLILLGGSLGDRHGRRRIFVVGVAWFTIAWWIDLFTLPAQVRAINERRRLGPVTHSRSLTEGMPATRRR